MEKPLPNDMSRCYGVGCSSRYACRRNTTMDIDQPALLTYIGTLKPVDSDTCDSFIEDKEAIDG